MSVFSWYRYIRRHVNLPNCPVHTGCVRKNETTVHFFTISSVDQKVFILEKIVLKKLFLFLSENKFKMFSQNLTQLFAL
jgi:hypothetical protein